MTDLLHHDTTRTAGDHAADERCPRCGGDEVRAIVYGPLDLEFEAAAVAGALTLDDAPIFDCRECGFEWGLAVRDLLA